MGVASYLLAGLDAGSESFVVMTASDSAGNEISIPPLGCATDAECDDGILWTGDSCWSDFACAYVPLPDGTAWYDFDSASIGELCVQGTCSATCRVDVDCESGAGRDYVLSWALPPDPGLSGFLLYLRLESSGYGEPLDLVPLDSNGVPFYALFGLDSNRTYHAVVMAYDETGFEWLVGDAVIPALACDPAPCYDANSCTADACTAESCTNQVRVFHEIEERLRLMCERLPPASSHAG